MVFPTMHLHLLPSIRLAESHANARTRPFLCQTNATCSLCHSAVFSYLSICFHTSCTIPISPILISTVRNSHLIERSHRLISTSNLNLEERSQCPITAVLRTLNLHLVRVIPGPRSTKYIFPFLALVVLPLVEFLGEDVLVGASVAFEPVHQLAFLHLGSLFGGCDRADGEDVAT